MPKATTNKKQPKATTRKKGREDRPVEFERGWHELEARHDKLKMDWAGLAALIGTGDGKDDGDSNEA
jgi:hypothetical protein